MAMNGGIKREKITRDQLGNIRCGGIQQVEIAEIPHIESYARFAVEEHNKKENSSLEFDKVVDEKRAVVSGIMYNINLEATDGGKKKLYYAKVWVKPWNSFMQVREFSLL